MVLKSWLVLGQLGFVLFLYETSTIVADPLINEMECKHTARIEQEKLNNPKDYPTCGGVLEASDKLNILSYNMEKPKRTQYVSCIWTIHAINGSLVKLNFTDPLDENKFAVGYFKKSNYDLLDSLTWNKIPISYDPQYLEVPEPVVFVHYYSDYSEPRFGFRMTFQAAGELQSSRYNYENYFLEGEFGFFKYPPLGGQYKNNQRTTIVLKVSPSLAPVVELLVKEIKHSRNCIEDNLNLYGYGETSGAWYKNVTLCVKSQFSHNHLGYPRNDPVIITFKSDDSDVGAGFELRWYSWKF